MARLARAVVFAPDEIAIVHVMNRVVRRCFLLGSDELTGKNYDHRKPWIEQLIQHFAGCFGIDVLSFAILSNHFHQILRSRPDVVATWSDSDVARRWLVLCPLRKDAAGKPEEPSETELNMIRNDAEMVHVIRRRLSDISWWMRLLCQRIATRANQEDHAEGKFWQARFKAVRILDEESLLACAAYVDLNPIRAAMAQTLEQSDHTSVQRRIQARQGQSDAASSLAPIALDERAAAMCNPTNPMPSTSSRRCSDLGFLPMSLDDYLELLDWTARQTVAGKRGQTPAAAPAILERLSYHPTVWCELVGKFGRLFFHVAGRPQTIDGRRSRSDHRFNMRRAARDVFSSTA